MRNRPSSRQPVYQVQPSQQKSGPGFGSYMLAGVGMGAGSELAHQAVRGLIGSNQQPQPPQQSYVNSKCNQFIQEFLVCAKSNPSNVAVCQNIVDMNIHYC